MNSHIFTYLRRKKLTDTLQINRLFVSAFVALRKLSINNNHLLSELLITKEDEQYSTLQEFITLLRHSYSDVIKIEDLITLFEFVISPADRIVTGAIYTPKYIRNIIIESCLVDIPIKQMHTIRVADIACGCGGFLMDMALLLHEKTGRSFFSIYQESIYGIDIQDYSVDRTKILLSLLALIQGEDSDFAFNVRQADSLDFNTSEWNHDYNHFDVIVGNPPYVCSRNVDSTTKEKMLKYEVCKSGHPDLYIPFFQIATEMLNDGGKLGLITMNSFIRSVNGRSVRKFFSQGLHKISILDFRGFQVFKKKSTYTCLFFLTKNQATKSIRYAVNENGDLNSVTKFSVIPYCKLDDKKGWSLNDFDKTCQLESRGTPIGKYCQSRHGIATLSNKIYIFKPIAEDDHYYYMKFREQNFAIEKSICRNVINSNKLNSEVVLENLVEKLIFPYIICNGRAIIIDETTMKSVYPCAYRYLSLQRELLAKRDKGKTDKYPEWYAYGRTQSLIMPRYKLFFPKFANKPLHCVIIDDVNLMLYNGIAFVSDSLERLQVLKKAMDSDTFWQYIVKNAKPYSSGYYSLSGVDIKNFCIPTEI